MRYKSNDQGFLAGAREARRWRPAQIWVQSFDGSPKRRLTDTRYSHRSVVVSPDGQWVAFVADAQLRPDSVAETERDSLAQLPYDRKRDEVERNDADIYVMPIAGGTPRKVATLTGNESDITWAADSKRIAFIGRPGRTKSARIYVLPLAGGAPENVLGTWKYEPENIEWLANGSLSVTASVGGSGGVFRLDPTTKKMTQILSGRRRVIGASYDAADRKMAFVATDLTHPTELFVANADGSGER